MLKDSLIHQIIGISGAARSGKDTLCRSLIRILKEDYDISAERKSIAGDKIKLDLKNVLYKSIKINTFSENDEDKLLIRPLLVEYGKIMRKKTNGRYFVQSFKKTKNKICIIPDIRYAEYDKDELYWLKNEMNGYLIFLNRENVEDANETEKINNVKLKNCADYSIYWGKLDENDENDRKIIDDYSRKIINNILKLPFSDRTTFSL